MEVGQFGLEGEIERLKRDKNVLMLELVRLRQHQQATERDLQVKNSAILWPRSFSHCRGIIVFEKFAEGFHAGHEPKAARNRAASATDDGLFGQSNAEPYFYCTTCASK